MSPPKLGLRPTVDIRGMNKTEQAYAAYLEQQRMLRIVYGWAYEPVKFKLANRTFYTPDFGVWYQDGKVEMIEIKGPVLRDDAAVKFKVARAMYPMMSWRMLKRVKGPLGTMCWVEMLGLDRRKETNDAS